MSVGRIRITPEQVEGVAREFKAAAEQSQQMIQRLDSRINALSGDWEGMTKQRFYTDYQAWKTQMTQFTQVLRGVDQQLTVAATKFRQTDSA